MLYLAIKAAVSGIVVALASEVARRSPGWGALIVSLPLVSLLTFVWLWFDTRDGSRIAELAQSTFWFFLPTIPMFLLIPWMIRHQVGFWAALAAGCVMTVALYLAMIWLAPRIGLRL